MEREGDMDAETEKALRDVALQYLEGAIGADEFADKAVLLVFPPTAQCFPPEAGEGKQP